ncbi:histidine kinase/DNA gyrase B/HSP90-like ATPase [Arcticibacter tournemirensis]|nr:ATP-binding protein [Arcticibacter tournemirensis]TQM48894.1 histidine kinase/DNA gyrase B/HSP90-like ATPase [Arcticibacter tournemirensis]
MNKLQAEKKIKISHVHIDRSEIEETGEYDLEGLFIRLEHDINSIGAKRVVLDTIENLFAGLSNEGILRAELRRLFNWLKDKGVTSIITGERGDGKLTRQGLEEYVSDCVMIAGNAERLEQVFMNLVSNAVKYSQDNYKIIIKAFLKDSMAEVRITDFGIGLSDDQKELIFERFYRVEDKKFLASGLGMGLYICSEIIAAHNGVLGVESELGKGSTFYFRIPVSAAPV